MKPLYNMGNTIKEKRLELGLTQRELAEKLSVSDKAVSKWERCESLPDISVIPSLALALNVSIDYLMTGDKARCTQPSRSDGLDSGESVNCDETTTQAAATALSNKINQKYLIAICIVIAIAGLYFGLDIIINMEYIQIINYLYRPFLYIFYIAIAFLFFDTKLKNDKELLSQMGGGQFKSNLGKFFIITVIITALFIIKNSFVHDLWIRNLLGNGFGQPLYMLFAYAMGGQDSRYGLYFDSGLSQSIAPAVYIAAAMSAMFFVNSGVGISKKTATISAAAIVMYILHRFYFSFTAGIIIAKKQNLYTFYFENPNTLNFLNRLATYNNIYAAVVMAIAIAVIFICKGKKDRVTAAVILVGLAVYLIVSAFGFIDRSFDGMGSYYAKLRNSSINCIEGFIFICPYLVIILDGILGKIKKFNR